MLVLVVLLLAASCASMVVGARIIPVEAIFDSSHRLHGIADVRVDRTLLGLAVGGALGLVGALMQGLTRNPLADPGILGINAGASLAMVLAISMFDFFDLRTYVWFGFAGAAIAMVLVHLVAALGRDGASPMKIAIAGAALTAAVTSWTQAVLLTDGQTIEAFRLWSVGTIGGRDTDVLLVGLPFLVVGAVLGLASIGSLNALALGDDLARGLGRRLVVDRFVIGVAIVLLAGSGDGAGRSDRLRRPDRAARRTRSRRSRLPPGAAAEHGVRRCAGPRRRRARSGRPPPGRGAGRHHDRRRRGALLPPADPARPDGESLRHRERP